LQAVTHEMRPLLVRERSEGRINLPEKTLRIDHRREFRRSSDIGENPLRGCLWNKGTRVVDDEAPDRRVGLRCQNHPDEPTHRCADEVENVAVEAREERGDVRAVGGQTVVLLIGEPVTSAAADDIQAGHPPLALQSFREVIEVAPVTAQSVDADDDRRVVPLAPLGVGDAVKAFSGETQETTFDHGELLNRSCLLPSMGSLAEPTREIL
jgi:hypothetical protein